MIYSSDYGAGNGNGGDGRGSSSSQPSRGGYAYSQPSSATTHDPYGSTTSAAPHAFAHVPPPQSSSYGSSGASAIAPGGAAGGGMTAIGRTGPTHYQLAPAPHASSGHSGYPPTPDSSAAGGGSSGGWGGSGSGQGFPPSGPGSSWPSSLCDNNFLVIDYTICVASMKMSIVGSV